MKSILKYLAPVLPGLLLLPVPLLRDFHFESAMLVAVTGAFWAALSAPSADRKEDFFEALRIVGAGYLFGLPLFIFSAITGCLTIDGVGFWLLVPVPSIFLGRALGRLIREFEVPYPRSLSVLILLGLALGIWLIEFFSLPQVYFFNHVWGLWPGPIYDEAVSITGSLLFFRWITILWIILLWVIPEWNKTTLHKLITGFAFVALLLSYLNLDDMGIITPRQRLQAELTGQIQTEHFDVYYDEEAFTDQEANYWALRHEFHFRQVNTILDIDWPEGRKIESYLYANAWQKKKLVGAKFTSYVPIWLEQDQLHIAKQQLGPVLKHEMVHVISKQFGNRLFNGSWSIGMIEGVAEAIAKDASPESTLEQIIAAEPPYPNTDQMRSALSALGFYQSAASISYTTSGAFVQFLLKEYPSSRFKEAYRNLDFDEAYEQPLDSLVQQWKRSLRPVTIDSVDRRVSEFIYGQRSLFQRPCPHSISEPLQIWDDFLYHISTRDTVQALQSVSQLYTLDRSNLLVKREWASTMLYSGNYEEVHEEISAGDSVLTLQLIKADAYVLDQRWEDARSTLAAITPELQQSEARNFRYSLALRADSLEWRTNTSLRYLNQLPDYRIFEKLGYPNKMLSLARSVILRQDHELLLYSRNLLDSPAEPDWFDVYEALIYRLVFIGEYDLTQQWLQKISEMDLRARYLERLEELEEWKTFLEQSRFVR